MEESLASSRLPEQNQAGTPADLPLGAWSRRMRMESDRAPGGGGGGAGGGPPPLQRSRRRGPAPLCHGLDAGDAGARRGGGAGGDRGAGAVAGGRREQPGAARRA